MTRALVLAGLTMAATLVLRSPEAATDALIAMPPVEPPTYFPISVSNR
ncbi:hypothetical protein ACQP1K_10340 [Sphaerimonospora sp. CA-214678]